MDDPTPVGQRIDGIRREHSDAGGLEIEEMNPDPFEQFGRWLEEAIEADLFLPNSMTLATADRDGRPSARITLLKGFDRDGFVFFSNYESHKGRELEENPQAALVFYWAEPGRQVRVEGAVERVTEEESFDYLRSRSRGSRLGAWASRQSQVIPNRDVLDEAVRELDERHPEEIPLPPYWGGYRLAPSRFEFWKGRPSRLHDRFQYTPNDDGTWHIQRLAP